MDLCIKVSLKNCRKTNIGDGSLSAILIAVPSFEIEPCTNHTLEVTQSKKRNIKDTCMHRALCSYFHAMYDVIQIH